VFFFFSVRDTNNYLRKQAGQKGQEIRRNNANAKESKLSTNGMKLKHFTGGTMNDNRDTKSKHMAG